MVLTTIEPRSHGTGSYDAYEYVVHSHQYITDDIPAARFSYELSPIQVREEVMVTSCQSAGCDEGVACSSDLVEDSRADHTHGDRGARLKVAMRAAPCDFHVGRQLSQLAVIEMQQCPFQT